jgi:imidazolonepropionase-like amidohydrolase
MRIAPVALLLFLSTLYPALPLRAQTQTYSVIVAGRTAGQETITPDGRGAVRVSYSYNDRGRGPEIAGRYVFDDAGMPVDIELTGKDYSKAPVEERFTERDGVSRWTSLSETGEAKSRAWYVTAEGPPSEMAWLVRAYLKRGDAKAMLLLPSGSARVDRGPAVDLTAHSRHLRVTLYRIEGLGFAPDVVWLDESNEFFAFAGSFSVIREGWEDARTQLLEAQTKAGEARYRDLAARLSHRPAQGLVIRHVRIFDSERAAVLENQAVTIRGDRIAAVSQEPVSSVPAGAEVIDGAGRTLLPGLFDMHVHFEDVDGLLDIACGVTSVRDMGNDMDALLRMKRQMDAGETIGPRVVLAGVIDGRGPFTAPTNVLADTEQEARAAIERYHAAGYMQIKIYSSVKPELVPYVARTAHALGMRVSGHVPAGMVADQFVDAGADEIQHMNFIFLNFMPDEAKNTNGRTRLTAPAARAAGIDQNSAAVAGFIAKLKEKQTVVDPTLGTFEGQYVARAGTANPGYTAILDRLPVQMRRTAYHGGLPVPEGQDQVYRDSFQAMLRMTARLYQAGVPLVIGTDGTAGLMLHRELELWVQAGIPPEKVLQIATLRAAKVARVEKDLGSIAAGKLADLVLVDGNPAQSISDIRKTRITIKNGAVFQDGELYQALGMTAP